MNILLLKYTAAKKFFVEGIGFLAIAIFPPQNVLKLFAVWPPSRKYPFYSGT